MINLFKKFWRVYWQGWLENHVNIWENIKQDISLEKIKVIR